MSYIEKPSPTDEPDEATGVLHRDEDPKLDFKSRFYRIWKNRLYELSEITEPNLNNLTKPRS